MTDESATPTKASFGSRLLSGFFTLTRVIVRVILIFLLVSFLAALLFGVPYVYWRFVTPAMNEFQHLSSAQVEQEQLNQKLLDDLKYMQERAKTLETRLDAEKQNYGEIKQSINGLISTQQAQGDVFTQTQIAVDQTLSTTTNQIATLEDKMVDLENSLEQFRSDVAAVEERSKAIETRLFSEDEPINQLSRDIQILKAMELLTRSRLFISQENLGLATKDVQSARDLLSSMQVPEAQVKSLEKTIHRLDLALGNLPDSPNLASQDLEIAWQLLNSELFSALIVDKETLETPTTTGTQMTATVQPSETATPSTTP